MVTLIINGPEKYSGYFKENKSISSNLENKHSIYYQKSFEKGVNRKIVKEFKVKQYFYY